MTVVDDQPFSVVENPSVINSIKKANLFASSFSPNCRAGQGIVIIRTITVRPQLPKIKGKCGNKGQCKVRSSIDRYPWNRNIPDKTCLVKEPDSFCLAPSRKPLTTLEKSSRPLIMPSLSSKMFAAW
uniref:Uncharacterized protein n=1 Tax=Romanomermis culicivorax TaxID=13658 RepID=A0A915IQR5_ROMCU